MPIFYNQHQTTSTLNGVASGTTVGMAAVFIGNANKRSVEGLSANLLLDVETSTLTVAAKWQVSNDKSTWVDLAHAPNNPAAVVVGTGTGGADASITLAIPALEAVYGYKWARIALVTGVTTGASADTYTVGYSYRKLS